VCRSEHELELRLDEPLPIYPALLTEGSTAIVRPAGAGSRLIGTGPFALSVHTPDRIVVDRNPSYWRSGVPRLDAIEFLPAMTPATIGRRFRAGELDLARDLLPQELEQISRETRFRLADTPKKNTYFVLFNARCGPATRRLGLRRALAGVVRARDLVWQCLGRFAEPATGLIPPGMLGHDAGRRWPTLTREQAIALLAEAGGDRPIKLTATVQPALRDRAGSLLASLESVWADLGVELHADHVDLQSYLASWSENAAVDVLVGRWNADYDDPDNFTHTLFHSEHGWLRHYFSSEESDRVLEDARAEPRPAVRETLYRRFEDGLYEQAVLVPLFHDIDYRLASPKVRGLRLSSTPPYVNYSDLGKAEDSAGSLSESRRPSASVVHVPIAGSVTSLDPAQQMFAELADVLPAIFETLTRQQGQGRVEPALATSVRAEDGGQRFRFRLRDDVRFHNGRRLTARDVRYSLERVLRQSPERELFWSIQGAPAFSQGAAAGLSGFRIVSAVEFTIDLAEPVAFFPAILSYAVAAILPEGGDPAAGPAGWVGTGPFRVARFEPGRRLELERNRSYWRSGFPRSDRLTVSFGVSPEQMLAGLRDGHFSLVSDLFPHDVEKLCREPEFASGYLETPRLTSYYAVFNSQRPPLADRTLRRRLVASVEVARLVRQTVGRFGVPAHGLIPPGLLAPDPDALPHRAPGAAGETISGRIELTAAIHPKFQGPFVSMAREIIAAFDAAGFTLRPVTPTMTDYNETVARGDVDLALARWNADYPDADSYAGILHSTRGWFGRMLNSSESDQLIERARAETIPAVRHMLYRELEATVARDALLLPLFHEQSYRIARPDVEGLSLSVGFPTVAFEELRVRNLQH
jgi:peptide/nickel transport system substrate-binding protein/oligopeptide transport system substrate-binding protein